MHAHQRPPPHIYATSPYGIPAYGTVTYQTAPLDVNWYDAWSSVRSILLAAILLICSTVIIGLDIANLAIEGSKQNGTAKFGLGTGKVGAGIWTGSVSFLAAITIIIIIFMRNKRVAATFALITVTLAFFFTIALIGLIGNAVQNNLYLTNRTDAEKTQDKILVAILSITVFIMILCIIFFIMYIRVFFSPATRQSTKY